MKNKLYWSCNLPLQFWTTFQNPEDENSPVIGASVLKYMPKKESVCHLELNYLLKGEENRGELFERAALHFESLVKMFREAAGSPKMTIYYHDDGMER